MVYCNAGGPVVPGPPFKICPPHLTFGPPVCIHQILKLKIWSSLSFLAALLQNPGDGPAVMCCIRDLGELLGL